MAFLQIFKTCPKCAGTGLIPHISMDYQGEVVVPESQRTCDKCNGSTRIHLLDIKADFVDIINDILDKTNDIKEKLDTM